MYREHGNAGKKNSRWRRTRPRPTYLDALKRVSEMHYDVSAWNGMRTVRRAHAPSVVCDNGCAHFGHVYIHLSKYVYANIHNMLHTDISVKRREHTDGRLRASGATIVSAMYSVSQFVVIGMRTPRSKRAVNLLYSYSYQGLL